MEGAKSAFAAKGKEGTGPTEGTNVQLTNEMLTLAAAQME